MSSNSTKAWRVWWETDSSSGHDEISGVAEVGLPDGPQGWVVFLDDGGGIVRAYQARSVTRIEAIEPAEA